MGSERFLQIENLFHQALERPPEQRDAWLWEQCGGDVELRSELLKMLAVASDGSFLAAAHTPGSLATPASAPITRIGPYRVVRELGRGGMGAVYLAVHEGEDFERTVAIKLLRTGLGGDLLRRRLATERQILAGLDHPGIARLYDGGTSEDDQPYIVMEHVEGETLLDYCHTRELGVPERLRLMLRVCTAVHYAHQHLVVHRDLKPSNIMVTADGQPKLLDFGIAKLLQPQAPGEAGTVTSLRWMTPEYASPEQVRGEAVTTASDVYSLGVVLFEVLAQAKPFRVTTGSVHEIEHAILEQQPARPSTAAQAPRLRRLLRGDLDKVVLKALEKLPARRYATAMELADELQRHLDGLPVRAQTGSIGYRAGKFVRRHRVPVAAAALAALGLVIGLAVALRQAENARVSAALAESQRVVSERRLQDVRALANTFLFEVHDAIVDVPGATEARAVVLRRGVGFLDKLAAESAQNPELQNELARTYVRIASLEGATIFQGHFATSEGPLVSLGKALRLAEAATASQPHEVRFGVTLCSALCAHGWFYVKQGEAALAERVLGRANDHAQRMFAQSPRDPDAREALVEALLAHGVYLHLHQPLHRAEALYRRALDVVREPIPAWRNDSRVPGLEQECLTWLAMLTGHAERWQEALELSEALQQLVASRLAAHPDGADARRMAVIGAGAAGWALVGLRRPEEALVRMDWAVAISQQLATQQNAADQLPEASLARILEVRSEALAALGRRAEALADLERALSIYEPTLAEQPASAVLRARAAWALRLHAENWLAAGRPEAPAMARLQRALALLEANLALDAKGSFDRLNRARILSTLARVKKQPELHRSALAAWRELASEQVLPPSERSRAAIEERALRLLERSASRD